MARVRPTPTGDVVSEAGPAGSPPEMERAEVDLLIDRADLGPGSATLIAAGDPIPAELAGLPRRPRTPEVPE